MGPISQGWSTGGMRSCVDQRWPKNEPDWIPKCADVNLNVNDERVIKTSLKLNPMLNPVWMSATIGLFRNSDWQ